MVGGLGSRPWPWDMSSLRNQASGLFQSCFLFAELKFYQGTVCVVHTSTIESQRDKYRQGKVVERVGEGGPGNSEDQLYPHQKSLFPLPSHMLTVKTWPAQLLPARSCLMVRPPAFVMGSACLDPVLDYVLLEAGTIH